MITTAAAFPRTPKPPTPPADRELGDLLQEIAQHSPKDIFALKIIAKMMLERIHHSPASPS